MHRTKLRPLSLFKVYLKSNCQPYPMRLYHEKCFSFTNFSQTLLFSKKGRFKICLKFCFILQTRYKCIKDPDSLRPLIDEFLEQIFLTDCVLVYSPSQVALAAIFHATSQVKAHLDSYVTDVLFPPERLPLIIEAVKSTVIPRFFSVDNLN